jgi:hypothetical protein
MKIKKKWINYLTGMTHQNQGVNSLNRSKMSNDTEILIRSFQKKEKSRAKWIHC